MSREHNKIYEFGAFQLNPAERLLLRDGHPAKLRPKVFDTLRLLVENHGSLVSKDEFFGYLWPSTSVEDNNLAHNVAELRRALGETPAGEKFIETVPLRGYRFVASVREVAVASDEKANEAPLEVSSASPVTPQPRATPATGRSVTLRSATLIGLGIAVIAIAAVALQKHAGARAHAHHIDSLAVLPFVSLVTDEQVERFCDSLTEELTTRVSRISGVRVPARTVMFQYKGISANVRHIAAAVQVKALLEGSVRGMGGRFVIHASLIDARDGGHLWSETYDRSTDDLIGLQQEVAELVGTALETQLFSEAKN